jgi:hypothetical protein
VLRYIQYTNTGGAANGSFAVVLRYAARPDSIRGFHAGSAARQTQRITAIQTYRGFVPPAAGSLDGAAVLGIALHTSCGTLARPENMNKSGDGGELGTRRV